METREYLKAIFKDAHKEYLHVWEIQTVVAENDGEWTQETQHQTLETIKNLASIMSSLALICEDVLDETEAKK